ncbi:hypothetical protein HY502_01410 [Candidatus Woesebacteria bacterium]|nr:hypothetical protein [Candidatus Woesebacteria bacterium]
MRGISLLLTLSVILASLVLPRAVLAQPNNTDPSVSPTVASEGSPTPSPRQDLTQKSEETQGHLEAVLEAQKLGAVWPNNPVKYAIRGAVGAGVPANTIVLLLLLPIVAFFIAAARHIIGLRGFGIFLPAALSVTFVATGPTLGILLFLLIVTVSTAARIVLRRAKLKLQYLPRMALILWLVSASVLGVLFMAPIIKNPEIGSVSIFAVLILALLAEDFTKVQLGKSVKTAVAITTETLILSMGSFLFLTHEPLQVFALLNPEILLIGIGILNFLLGKYSGLRVLEIWRFRRLLKA